MAGINLVRNRLYEKYRKQGLGEEEALTRADKESQVKVSDVKKIQEKESKLSRYERLKKRIIEIFKRRNK